MQNTVGLMQHSNCFVFSLPLAIFRPVYESLNVAFWGVTITKGPEPAIMMLAFITGCQCFLNNKNDGYFGISSIKTVD